MTSAARLAVLALAGVLAGCSNASSAATQGAHASAAGSPGSSTIWPTPRTSAGATGVVVGPGTFVLPDPAAGLDTLSSYRATLHKTFNGTATGSPTVWSVTAERKHTANPAADALSVEVTGSPAEHPGQVVGVGGVVYTIVPGRDCVAGVIDGVEAIWAEVELAKSISAVIGADADGAASQNGIAVDHFAFDERAIGLAGMAHATGELWTASDGGYLVKYRLAMEAGAEYFGEGTSGTITWEYELLDVGTPMTIEPPAGCPAGLIDAPTPPDATDVVRQAGLMTYTTKSTLGTVATFYKGKAAGLGWTSLGSPLTTKTEGVLEYSSATGKVTVLIVVEATGTKVTIVLDPATT